MRMITSSLSALILFGMVAVACGGSDGSEVDGGTGTGASTGVPGGGLNLGGTTGTTGNGTQVIDPGSACADDTASASLSGVNMIVMFDRSTSMLEGAGGATRWQLTSDALRAFFASPEAAGLNLALRFFPHDLPAAGCNQSACDVQSCSTPLVGLGELLPGAAPGDKQEEALINAVMTSAPMRQNGGMMGGGMMSGGTPISAALGGALEWAKAQHASTPTEHSVVVLVTDGQPNGCDEDVGNIAGLARAANMADGTLTYAIGLTGSREGDMDEIAQAGGTQQGIFIADGANTTQDLLDALSSIRGQILDCDFEMPVPKPGVEVEPALINVNYTPSTGKMATLPQVSSEGACAGNQAWYYDNPTSPTKIILCKAACDVVQADPAASLQILLGCPTSTNDPA
jgi:hypothetical protein